MITLVAEGLVCELVRRSDGEGAAETWAAALAELAPGLVVGTEVDGEPLGEGVLLLGDGDGDGLDDVLGDGDGLDEVLGLVDLVGRCLAGPDEQLRDGWGEPPRPDLIPVREVDCTPLEWDDAAGPPPGPLPPR